MTLTPEQIAATLSEAEARRLDIIDDVPMGGERSRVFTGHGLAACRRLVEKGLAHEVGGDGLRAGFQITPLGLAVRNHLEQNNADG